jgi:hypothetical protein
MDPIQYRSSDELKALSKLEDKKNKRLADQLRKMKELLLINYFTTHSTEKLATASNCLVCANWLQNN